MAITTPSVYIGCLQCYNEGKPNGQWYDAEDADEVTSEEVHGYETAHVALWCLDNEGFAGLLGEVSPAEAARIARIIAALDDDEQLAAFAVWHRNEVGNEILESEIDTFREQLVGIYDSEADFAHKLAEDLGELREDWPYRYIDWAAAARDLILGGDFARAELPNGCIVVWRSC